MTALLDAKDIGALLEAIDQLDRPAPAETATALRRHLNSIGIGLGQIESYVGVSESALRSQAIDIDIAVATVLAGTGGLISVVNASLEAAYALLPRISLQPPAPELAAVRDKLKMMQGSVP